MASSLQRFILWDYPRGSWQYDLVVVLIVAFIFLTPREIFRDQPKASNVVLLPSEGDGEVFFLEPKTLSGQTEPQAFATAAQMLSKKNGKNLELYRLTPIFDTEKEIKGYMAYTRLKK